VKSRALVALLALSLAIIALRAPWTGVLPAEPGRAARAFDDPLARGRPSRSGPWP